MHACTARADTHTERETFIFICTYKIASRVLAWTILGGWLSLIPFYMLSLGLRFVVINFLAHLLCALVIYLLSKLCCNKILTICFISLDLHLPCLSFLCLLPCLDLPFLFSFTSFYLIRLGCVCFGFSVGRLLPISFPFSRPWLSIVHYAHSLSLSLFVSLYLSVSLCDSLTLSLSLCMCCWSINSDDTAVTSKCLFLFRFSFYFYFRWQLTPSRVLCFWS